MESWTYSQTKNQWATKGSAVSAKSFKVGNTEVIDTSGKVSAANLKGSINSTAIGATTPNTGKFTTLEATGATTLGATTLASASVSGNLAVTGDATVTNNTTLNGNLTVNGAQSNTDKSLVLAAGATTNTGVTNAGILLGSPTTLESWLYDGANWEASAPVKAESFKVGNNTVINSSGEVPLDRLKEGLLPSTVKITPANLTTTPTDVIDLAQGGTGGANGEFPQHSVLLGPSFASAKLTHSGALTDGQILVGKSGAPARESGSTLRDTIGVGTGDTPLLAGVSVGNATDYNYNKSECWKH